MGTPLLGRTESRSLRLPLPEQASSLVSGSNPALMFLGQLIFLQDPQYRSPTDARGEADDGRDPVERVGFLARPVSEAKALSAPQSVCEVKRPPQLPTSRAHSKGLEPPVWHGPVKESDALLMPLWSLRQVKDR